MSRDTALAQINMFENALTLAVRGVVDALANDGRIDMREGMDLGASGLMLAFQVTNMLRSLGPESAKDMLYVLEHSDRILPADST